MIKYTKEEIEKALWEKFIELYNKKSEIKYSYLRNWIQWKEADIIFDNNLQIEVVSNHYDKGIKKQIEKDLEIYSSSISMIKEPDRKSIDFLLDHVKIKNEKLMNWNYWYWWVCFLLIDVRENCLTTLDDFYRILQKVKFNKIYFNEIWLFHNRIFTNYDDINEKCIYDNKYWILRIYKNI